MSQPPAQQYPAQQSPYPPPVPPYYQPPPEKKDFLGIPKWIWVIIVVIIIILPIIAFSLLAFSTSEPSLFSMEPQSDTERFSSHVIIAEGGHFRITLQDFYFDELEVTMNISSKDGKKFDVYIMDWDQYDMAYGLLNTSGMAFSAEYSKENINKISETITLSPERWRPFYLVIDNRDTAITPDDAIPSGTLEVDAEITITTAYYYD